MATIDTLVDLTQTIKRDADRQRAEAEAEHAAALEARRLADQRADQAAATIADATRTAGRQYLTEMRRLTAEVRAARQAATDAIHTGQQPLETWLAYRRLRAHNQGTWQALAAEYTTISGRPAPRGEWGPPLTAADDDRSQPPETFADFLTTETTRMERDTADTARSATTAAIHSRKA